MTNPGDAKGGIPGKAKDGISDDGFCQFNHTLALFTDKL